MRSERASESVFVYAYIYINLHEFIYAGPNDRQISICKKASGKHEGGMQKRATIFIQRDNGTIDVLSLVDKQENAVNWEHIRTIHAFILLVAVAFIFIHTEFPCACTHKNVNKYGSVRIQADG